MIAAALLSPAATTAATGQDLSAYLSARVADADGRVGRAAEGYKAALEASPNDPLVAIRAYRDALAAGDDALAIRAAGVLRTAGVAPADVALLSLAESARRDNPAAVEAAVRNLDGGPLALLAPSLRGWLAFVRGEEFASALNSADEPLARRLARETSALLTIANGDDRGIVALRAAAAPADVSIAAAQLLFNRGHDAAARSVLIGDDPIIDKLRKGAPAKPTLAFGVSRLLTRVAGDLQQTEGSAPLAVALTRSALIADPSYDRARLLLAGTLAKDGATARAIEVLGAIDPSGVYSPAAGALRISVLEGGGRHAEALQLAQVRANGRDASVGDMRIFADLLMDRDRPAEAAPWYARILGAGEDRSWAAWLQYGAALDQAGNWSEAKVALQRAVTLGPQEPLALNYLGYSEIEHGEDAKKATELLVRARALAPDDASITDSLGWAYFRMGDGKRALPLLESASAASPANSEISEHLGDVYWSMGRRYEARYAWRAAMIGAKAAQSQRLNGKIANGSDYRRR